ncbi:uncharacterized protein LOC108740302 isoform X2 [Agrilus planipennis]|uniref:Uncharacterized protein LOC108740302 isoform X2 n=1 Tax=Agrilus planipennis TaxID=224129 RepID=A0A1W4XCL2_AGRPL|nr:uncharacterized protein LOC108740302 isoform X2 [Agrilus planipennis]
MENISKQHIAKLVLGYLKDEKCKKAFRYLLESSPYLRGYLRKVKKGKPISTRICGLNLVDIINEYSVIYRIIQERLESTNYFNKTQGKSSLEEQLIYLLNRVEYSPSSSPCSFATRSSSEKDFSFIHTSGNICNDSSHRDSSQREDNIVDCVDNIETRATLSSSLPGNVNRSTESATSTASTKSARLRHEDLELVIELVSQKLAQNRDFHEKLAENINKELISFSTSPCDEKQNPLNQEMDNVIKTVLQKTEADPLFHKLLTDVLDSVEIHNLEDSSQNDSLGDNGGQDEQRTSSQSPNDLVIACSDSDQSKKDASSKVTTTNFEKPLEIQAPSHFLNTSFTNLTNSNIQTQQLSSEYISNTVYIPEVPSSNHLSRSCYAKDSSISHFINVASTVPNCITIPTQPLVVHNSQNQGLINTSGLLMVQQQNQNPSKSYQVIGGKPLVNIAPKWTPLNEQDIMSMPTVFISDNQSMIPSIAGQSLPTAEMGRESSAKKAKRKIAPKTNNNMPSLINSPHLKTPFEQKKIKTLLPKPSVDKDSNTPPKINITITTTTTTTSYDEPYDSRSIAGQVNDPIITTPLSTDANSCKKPTPKSNSSHVRQLDFSTPEKPYSEDQEDKIKETKEINEAVENVKTKDISSRTKSWDADLRALVGTPKTQTEIPTKTPAKKRKRTNSTTNNQSKSTDENQAIAVGKNKKKKQSSSSSSSSTCSQDVQETKKPAASDSFCSENGIIKTDVEAEKPTPEETIVEVPIQKIEHTEPKSKHIVEEQENVGVGIECVVINRDIKPTYKRKCNIDNSKRNMIVEKFVPSSTTSFNGKNGPDVIDDMSPTLILSPTKLNANKRSIVEIDNKGDELLETPDEVHISKTAPILNAKRNITPSLETPFKKGQPPPKTPHFLSPVNTSDTPFTKVLKEQLQGLDLASFPTPKFPLTPDFSVTPLTHDQSPYSRRSTDYSTCSSYYQPSDTEQTKSIEQLLIEESIRLENKLETPTKNNEESKSIVAHFSHNDINKKRSNFNNIMTGKKNLSLLKEEEKNLHLDLSSSEDNCSFDDESSKGWIDNHTNDTVIQNKIPYSLRSRGTVAEIRKQEEISKGESNIHDPTKTNDISNKSAVDSKNFNLLQSLEEKRKSVIAKLKQDDLKREEENQKSLQRNKAKTTGNKSVSKKKAGGDSARKNNSTQKKQTQSKINIENVHSNSEELSKVEKPSNKQKKVPPANPKIKGEKLVEPIENLPFSSKMESNSDDPFKVQMHAVKTQAMTSTSKDKAGTEDSKEAKIENSTDKNKNDTTISSKDKDVNLDKKLEEKATLETTNVNTVTFTDTEKIDDTCEVDKSSEKATHPAKTKSEETPAKTKIEETNSLPENAPENSGDLSSKPVSSISEIKETTDSLGNDEKVSVILKEALLSNSRGKYRKASNPEEDIQKESSDKNLKQKILLPVEDKADFIDSKLKNISTVEKSDEPDKIIVHSDVKIFLDKLPDGSLKLKSQIQNNTKEETKITPHTTNECDQITSTSSKLNKVEAKLKKSDAPNNPLFKELQQKNAEKRSYRYSPVDEIVLHLSSDDSFGSLQDSASVTDGRSETLQPVEFTSRLLEPFELVQTQLHEFNSESERCNLEDQLRKLHEDNSANDPEILVKELKERGIHLMPAKCSKRSTVVGNSKNDKLHKTKTKTSAQTVPPKELNKKGEAKTDKSSKSSQIEAMMKEKKRKVLESTSLEEGEILSDLSDTELVSERQTKSNKTKSSRSLSQRKDLKVEVSRSRVDEKKRKNSTSSRDRGKKDTTKSSLTKSSNKSVKKIRPSSTKIAVEKSISNNVPSCNDKQSTSQKSNVETESNSQCTDRKPLMIDQNISTKGDEINVSLPFDTKVYDTETLHLVYDESKQSHGNKQYNFELLTKKISANVFIEEINCEIEKEMSFTSFTSTLDIPSTLNVNVLLPRKKAKVDKTCVSSLDKLYKKLVKNSPEHTSFNSSPLDSLYSPFKTGLYNRKPEVTEEFKKSKTSIEGEQKLTKNKNSVDKVSNRKNLKNKPDGSEARRSNSTKKSVDIPELPDDEIEVIDGVISFNTAEKVRTPDPNDELMNYAICGSVRIENDDTEPSDKKRKASANVDETHDEKKVRTDNCQELLKKIDVNSFLKKVHGNG